MRDRSDLLLTSLLNCTITVGSHLKVTCAQRETDSYKLIIYINL